MKRLTFSLLAFFFVSAIRAEPLSVEEKRDFVKWLSEQYEDEPDFCIRSGTLSRWEFSLVSFDFDGNGQEEIIVSNPCCLDGATDTPLVFRRVGTAWQMLPFHEKPFERLVGASIVELAGNRFRLAHLGMKTGRGYFKSFVCDRERATRSNVPGAPEAPTVSETQIDSWVSIVDAKDATAAGLPEESCIGVTDNGGGRIQFRCFYETMGFSLIGFDTTGAPTNQILPGGARDMIADPDFRSWIRSVPIDVFAGTNAEPRRLAEPRFARFETYRTNVETNRLSFERRALLAATLHHEGIPADDVWLVTADFDGDGTLDVFVSTNGVETMERPVEWQSWKFSGGEWTPLRDSVSPPAGIFRHGFYDRTVVPPSVPPVVVAGPDDFYRVWHAANGCFVNVFRITGPNPWDVASPLSDAGTPEQMKRTRFLNGYRRVYTDWIALHDFFHPETKIHPPCDFFDLFDGASGMIQLDRLMPEPLVPPEGGNANAPQ